MNNTPRTFYTSTPSRRAAALALPEVRAFDTLPDSAHIDVKAVAAIRGNSVAQVWRDCKSGRMPAPIRFSPRCTRWNVGTLRAWLSAQQAGSRT